MYSYRLAIISPYQNAYSETFIQAHRNLPGYILYYYGTPFPLHIDGHKSITELNLTKYLRFSRDKLIKRLKPHLSYNEKLLALSFLENNIQAVLAEYGQAGVLVRKVCKSIGIPLIVHFHGYDASIHHVLNQYKDEYRTLFDDAAAVISVSSAMTGKLIEAGCPPSKLHYNVYGPGDAFFEIVPDYSSKKLIGIGRFVDKKAPYFTILAFHKALQQHPDASLVLGGEGILLNMCINLTTYLKIEDKVSFPGVLSREQFMDHLSTARAFVQHSITAANGDMEGTPVAVLEASASALPVISTRHAGIPDVIIENETGLLSDEKDVDAMAANMIKLLNDRELAVSMGKKNRKNIADNYTLDRHLGKLREIIDNVIRKNHG